MSHVFLIVGLGNPGKAYDGTRHNVGFAALDLLAQKHGLVFRKKSAWKSDIAEGLIFKTPVILLKPLTYMNLSGEAVAIAMRYREVDLSQVIVIVDDVVIPLGQLRIRTDSGTGGHNGLKSIEAHLQTNGYARLRIGIGTQQDGDLADFVLSRFSEEENKLLPSVLARAVQAIEIWLETGLTSAMDFANKSPSNPSIGDKQ